MDRGRILRALSAVVHATTLGIQDMTRHADSSLPVPTENIPRATGAKRSASSPAKRSASEEARQQSREEAS